jgi:hypothetical protein
MGSLFESASSINARSPAATILRAIEVGPAAETRGDVGSEARRALANRDRSQTQSLRFWMPEVAILNTARRWPHLPASPCRLRPALAKALVWCCPGQHPMFGLTKLYSGREWQVSQTSHTDRSRGSREICRLQLNSSGPPLGFFLSEPVLSEPSLAADIRFRPPRQDGLGRPWVRFRL